MAKVDKGRSRPAPLQFGLRTLLGATTGTAVLFGVLRWLDVPPRASLMVLVVGGAGAAAALGLVVVITRWATGEDDHQKDDLI